MAKKKYDVKALENSVNKKIFDTLGKPVFPDWNSQYGYWKERVKYMPPRGFMYVYDLVKNRTILNYGLDILGHSDDIGLDANQVLNMLIENQRILMRFQIAKVHEIMLDINYNETDLDFYYGAYRGMKLKDGTSWLGYQTSEPFQIDSNGRIVSYLSWCHLLSPYRGEPMQTSLFHKNRNDLHPFFLDTVRKLTILQNQALDWLGFNFLQKQTIDCYASGMKKEEILHHFDIGEHALFKRNSSIIRQGKICFPVNNFKYATNVVAYLKSQGLV